MKLTPITLSLLLLSLSGRAHADDPHQRLRRCAESAEADLATRDEIDAAYARCGEAALRDAGQPPIDAGAIAMQDRIAYEILREVDEEHPLHATARATLARNAHRIDDMKRSARAAERAAMRRLRTRVLFGEVAPDTATPFRHATAPTPVPSCSSLALLAAPPPVRARDGFDLSVAVNGETCHNETFTAPAERELAAICGDKNVLQAGENRITVTIARNVNRRVGTRVDPDTLRVLPVYSNSTGKRLATARWRCTN
ncbi:MAG TPA: hypothetical protein VMZ28_17520 [Kofleriaceae bacterium]|nr:hypothetical protein [Kofleriaceae bacterium]